MTKSLERARDQYRNASADLDNARRNRNSFFSNWERDVRALEVKYGEERVGIALDVLWKAQVAAHVMHRSGS